VRVAQRGNVCGSGRRARPTARRDVENVDAVVVSCALSAADDNDLASYDSRGVRAAQRRHVSLLLRIGPLHRLYDGGKKKKGYELIQPHERLKRRPTYRY
jgi:hypothetical protein